MGAKICTFGSCVTRDVFHFTFPDRYEIMLHMGWNPVSIFQSDGIELSSKYFPFLDGKFYIRMMQTQFSNNAITQILNSNADYLVMDLAEERLDQFEIHHQGKLYRLADFWANTAIDGAKNGFWIEQTMQRLTTDNGIFADANVEKCPPLSIPMDRLEYAYRNFFKKIIKSDSNPKGFTPQQIIIFESYLAESILNESGKLQKFAPKWNITQKNSYLKTIYEMVYRIIPDCHVVKFPRYTYGNWHHIWGTNPLHYSDATYRYFASALDIITGYNKFLSTPEKLWKQQSLENQLAQRIANSTPLYDVIPMKRRLEAAEQSLKQAEAQIGILSEIIQKQQNSIDALQAQIHQRKK